MTVDTLFKRISMAPAILALSAALATATSFLLTVLFAGVMALWGGHVQTWAQDWLGITAIKHQIANITGESRVTQQPPGMSYVREPVYIGGDLTLVLHIGRTDVGAACVLEELVPVFMDDFGTTVAGDPRRPAQQIGPQLVRRELTMPVAPGLRPGRTSIALQLEYTCGGLTVFESTYPTTFMLEIPSAGGGH